MKKEDDDADREEGVELGRISSKFLVVSKVLASSCFTWPMKYLHLLAIAEIEEKRLRSLRLSTIYSFDASFWLFFVLPLQFLAIPGDISFSFCCFIQFFGIFSVINIVIQCVQSIAVALAF